MFLDHLGVFEEICDNDPDSFPLITGDIKEQLRRLKTKLRIKEEYEIEFIPSFTLGKTLFAIKERDHTDAIVLINIGTNDIRLRKKFPENQQSKRDPHQLVERIIQLLKTQTAMGNIVIVQSAPSLAFDIDAYNRRNFKLCDHHGVNFAYTMVHTSHLRDDLFHIDYPHLHVMAQTMAAAIVGINPFQAFDQPLPSRQISPFQPPNKKIFW